MISPSENLSPQPVLAAAIVSKPAATEGQIAGTHVRSRRSVVISVRENADPASLQSRRSQNHTNKFGHEPAADQNLD